MRTGSSDILSQGRGGRVRLDARLKKARKSRNFQFDLEGLESRTLLATIPAATPTAGPQNISTLFGNAGGMNASESSSVVMVDPSNPSKLWESGKRVAFSTYRLFHSFWPAAIFVAF